MSTSVPPPPQWPLRPEPASNSRSWVTDLIELPRDPGKGRLTGLSVALAESIGIDVLLVRTLFVVSTLSGGIGLFAYLGGWLITRDINSGLAPLDRLGERWRQLNPRTVVGWMVAMIVLSGLTLGSLLQLSYLPLVIIALTIWTGSRVQAPHTPPRPGVMAPRPGAFAAPQPRPAQPLWLITLVTLMIAGLAGGVVAELRPDAYVLILAVPLVVVGVGLVVAARHGLAIGLVIVGLLLVLGMFVFTFAAPPPLRESYTYTSSEQLADLDLRNSTATIDMAEMPVPQNATWRLNVTNSAVVLIPPIDQNVVVTVEYRDSMISSPDEFQVGQGYTKWSALPDPDSGVLTIEVLANDSQVVVTR